MNSTDYVPKHKMTHEELVKDFILYATMDTNESGRAVIKEIQVLKEQLARMGEALTLVLRICVRTDGLDMREFSNALSSYDPKWIEGVRAEARKKAMVTAYDKFLTSREEQFVNWLSREASQPNQSREKMG